jgi:hypothetical protein
MPFLASAQFDNLELTYEVAKDNKMYPFKFSQTLNNASDVVEPQEYIPIFSGCFDWHSSVHGHWLLTALLNRYPDTELGKEIIDIFDQQFTVHLC